MLYEMLHGQTPFDGDNQFAVQRAVLNSNGIDVPAETDPSAARLLKALLVRDPEARLGAGDEGTAAVKAHAFWKPLEFAKVLGHEYTPEWKPPPSGEKSDEGSKKKAGGEGEGDDDDDEEEEEDDEDYELLQVRSLAFHDLPRPSLTFSDLL